jgi:hypothetical protein
VFGALSSIPEAEKGVSNAEANRVNHSMAVVSEDMIVPPDGLV